MESKNKCRELYERMDSAIVDFVIAIRAVLPATMNAVHFEGPNWTADIVLPDITVPLEDDIPPLEDGRKVRMFRALSS